VTEAEWLTCSDPQPMLDFLRGKASNRKLWLFACGCCRRHPPLLADARCRAALEVGERYADGEASPDELAEASEEAFCRRADLSGAGVSEAIAIAAAFAVVDPAQRDPNLGVMTVVEAVQLSSSDLINAAGHGHSAEAERAGQCCVLRDVLGNPFRPVAVDPAWLTPRVVTLAEAIYQQRAFDQLLILADALEEAGCIDAAILDHLREPGPHTRGCWPLDAILGKT
jgi:hypothetical protein